MARCRIMSIVILGVTRAYSAFSSSTCVCFTTSGITNGRIQCELGTRKALGRGRRSLANRFKLGTTTHTARERGFRTMALMNDEVPRASVNRPKGSVLSLAISMIPTLLAGGAPVSATEISTTTSEMGARLDGSAAASFCAIVISFYLLQARIRKAAGARTARREFEKVLRETQSKRLSGMASEEDVVLAEERMAQLLAEEQDMRKVDILGLPFNVVLPDGGAGSTLDPRVRARELDQNGIGSSREDGALGMRDTMNRNAEADPGQRKDQDDTSPIASLKVAALWLVLISQLWLLLVLWNDPMGSATSTFLQD